MGGGFGGLGPGMPLLWLALVAVLLVVPFWRLLPQFGMPNWLAIFSIIPLGALILLWIMAFSERRDGGRA